MQEIAKAVQEGAAAYLRRQFRTLGVFVVIIFFILLLLAGGRHRCALGPERLLPGRCPVLRLTGFTRHVAVRCAVTSASPRRPARTAGTARCGSLSAPAGWPACSPSAWACWARTIVVLIYRANAPRSARRLRLRGRAAGHVHEGRRRHLHQGRRRWAPTWSARWSRASRKTTRGTPRRSPTTSGDNVGDCAGMAADLFESYAVMLVASLILGKVAFGDYGLVLPLFIPAIALSPPSSASSPSCRAAVTAAG